MPLAPASTSELFDIIRKSGIAATLPDPTGLPDEPQKAAGVLVQKGVITRFQAQQLLLGRHKGFRLGAYVILEQLGRGGMGVVYLAQHQELRRKVAIKVLVVGKDEDAKLAGERFFREARAAAALDHPNIVRIFDVCRHNDTPYLVMEYVEGETLQQTLDREGTLPHAAAAEAVAQAAAGLQHAYEKGFVHRDIKPGNLMRDRAGAVKILDMGLARLSTSAEDKLTERLDAGAVVGTADFIAPEQALNTPNVDIRADIYSLGASFFALVAGKPPFAGNTTQKLLQHQMATAPNLTKIDATLPKGLAGVAAKMLAKKPQDRYQTPGEVISALTPWLENSSRVLAGLSQTNLAAGADLHARLHEKAGGSTGRLRRPSEDAVSDSGLVNPADPAAETGGVASSRTSRSEPRRRKAGEPDTDRKRPLLPLIAGGIAVVASVAGIAFALGAFDREPVRDQVQTPPPPDSQKVEPVPAVVPAPKAGPTPPAPKNEPRVAYRLDMVNLPAFTIRGRSESAGKVGRDLKFVTADRTGADFPGGWTGQTWDKAGEAAFSVGTHAGRPCLGARNLVKTTAFLISPDVTFLAPAARVRFHYLTASAAPKAVIFKFKVPTLDSKTGLVEVATLPGTRGAWQVFDQTVPLRGHGTVFFEFHTLDADPDGGLFLSGFEAIDAVPESSEPVLARYDLAGRAPFAIRNGLEVKEDGSKVGKQLSRTGSGEPPAGWYARCWNPESQIEFFSDTAGGLGLRNVRGPGSAMLFSPTVAAPTGVCRLRVEYSAAVRADGFHVRFKPVGNRPAWDVARPAATAAGVWRTADIVVDLKGATAGVFEFHNGDPNPDAAVRVRTVTVSQPPAGTPVTPITTPGSAATAPAELFAGWAEGPAVYRFNAADVPPYRVTKEGNTVTAGEDAKFPRGVSARCWKKDATGEFRREDVDGAAAAGLTNLSNAKSAQFAFELERDMGVTLRPGAAYRVKVSYQTRNDASASVVVQTQDYKNVVVGKMAGPAGAWKVATATFERKDGVPVRLTIDNDTVGEGNTVYFRSVEVVELVPPAAAPMGAAVQEGAVAFKLDAATVPAFRVTKENNTRTGGDPEQLPRGVYACCWKKDATGDFRREEIDGAAAFGLTNFTDAKSAQFGFELEQSDGIGLTLRPGRYRIRLTYLARGETAGMIDVQTREYQNVANLELPATAGAWRTVTLDFTRAADAPLRMTIDNTAVGEGNTLYFRAVEVVELGD